MPVSPQHAELVADDESVHPELVELNKQFLEEIQRHERALREHRGLVGSVFAKPAGGAPHQVDPGAMDARADQHVFLVAALGLLEDKLQLQRHQEEGARSRQGQQSGRLIKAGKLEKRKGGGLVGRAGATSRLPWSLKDIALYFGQMCYGDDKSTKPVDLSRLVDVTASKRQLTIKLTNGEHQFRAREGDADGEHQVREWARLIRFAAQHVPPTPQQLQHEHGALLVGEDRDAFTAVQAKLQRASSKPEYLQALGSLPIDVQQPGVITVLVDSVKQHRAQPQPQQQPLPQAHAQPAHSRLGQVRSLLGTRSSSPAPQLHTPRAAGGAGEADQVFKDMRRDRLRVNGAVVDGDPDRAFGVLTRKIMEKAQVASAEEAWPALTDTEAFTFAHHVLVSAATRTENAGHAYDALELLSASPGLSDSCGSGHMRARMPLISGSAEAMPIDIEIRRRRLNVSHAQPLSAGSDGGSGSQEDEMAQVAGLEVEVKSDNLFLLRGPRGEGEEEVIEEWATANANFRQKFFLADEASVPVVGPASIALSFDLAASSVESVDSGRVGGQ
eukprot:g3694.t1